MEDEEKKAIDVIKSLGISIYDGKSQIIQADTTKEISTAIYTTINLIEKQQKEIEELKKYKDGYKLLNYSLNNFVSKDKIKAKIEEYQNKIDKLYNKKIWEEPVDTINKNRYVNYINVLQSLLEKEDNNE